MKKFLALLLAMALVLGLATACGGEGEDTPAGTSGGSSVSGDPTASADKKLSVWSFTNELEIGALAFRERFPDITVSYEFVSDQDGMFEQKLDAAISSGQVPDVAALEAAFVRKYVELDNALMSINDLNAAADAVGNYAFMRTIGTAPNGDLKALSWQATPGGFFYKRAVAKEYLGTEDPAEIQAMMSNMADFEALAAKLQEASEGAVVITEGAQTMSRMFYNNRSQPWIVNNKLVIDPKLNEFIETSKRMYDAGQIGSVGQWTDDWSASMAGTLTKADGSPLDILGTFLPTWGITFVIPDRAPNTMGEWAVVPGPMTFTWGGTWAGVLEGAPNAEVAKEFVKFVGTDVEHLKNWALGVYTNEYLLKIDPNIGDKSQSAGDFMVSEEVNKAIRDQMTNPVTGDFQNIYDVWMDIAPKVSTELLQGTDRNIDGLFMDAVNMYIAGEVASVDEALEAFKSEVRTALPELEW